MQRYANLIAADFVFTINNYTRQDEARIASMLNTYTVIWNRSIHGFLIGVIARKKQTAIDIRCLKRHLPRAHFEPLRGSFADAVNYINSIE